MMAPMVLPMAVPRVKNPRGIPFMNENRTAPTATPGQNRYPNSRMAASAMPAGGQTRATLPERNVVVLPIKSADEIKRDEKHHAREGRQFLMRRPFHHDPFPGVLAAAETFVKANGVWAEPG